MGMAEHREPYDARVSRTVLGARGGETPPRDSPSVPDDQGNEALALAGRRPGWLRARRSRPEPAGQAGRQAPASQAAEAAEAGTACHGHGQARQLHRGKGRRDALGRASEAQRIEQPGREFSSADPTSASSHPARLNASSPLTIRLPTSSASAAIPAPPASIEPPGPKPSRPGLRSPAWPLGHEPSCDWPSCALSRPEPIKLTVPNYDVKSHQS